jgi:hypothetical protein
MPIPTTTYNTFATQAYALSHTSYPPQWSKTVECDRLLNAIYDESLVSTVSVATRDARFVALNRYLNHKWGMVSAQYKALSGDKRVTIRDITLTNMLIGEDEIPIGRAGRFHRALTSVYNETVGHADKEAAFAAWCADAVQGIADALSLTPIDQVAPTVAAVPSPDPTPGFDHPHSDHHS